MTCPYQRGSGSVMVFLKAKCKKHAGPVLTTGPITLENGQTTAFDQKFALPENITPTACNPYIHTKLKRTAMLAGLSLKSWNHSSVIWHICSIPSTAASV